MSKYIINGGKTLKGEITISGAKNAAVAIIPAVLLVSGTCRLENIPTIIDVTAQLEILKCLGCKVSDAKDGIVEIVVCDEINITGETERLMSKIRSSYYILGACLGKYGEARVTMPGGCNFGGVRPIDQHIKGFEALGATVEIDGEHIYATAKNGLRGAHVYMDVVSVGATINIMLAATTANGQTIIENAAKEPHIVDVANFLNAMGAMVSGAGTDIIKIKGVEALTGRDYSIIPDQIEAGTYMALVTATGGQVLIKNVIPKHLECITAKLSEMGAEITEFDDSVLVRRVGAINKANVKTLPYPGFPTDMQPQIAIPLMIADGMSSITEGVWDNRFKYLKEVEKMGANVVLDGKIATITGVEELKGATLYAHDLRAGAACVIAGLVSSGTTEIEQISNIERGYENIVEKLRAIGADISRIDT